MGEELDEPVEYGPKLPPGIAPERNEGLDNDWKPGDPDPNSERVIEICDKNGWPMGIEIPEPPETIG